MYIQKKKSWFLYGKESLCIFTKGRSNERKAIAAVIAEILGCPFKYAGTPSYAYEAGGWTLERDTHSDHRELHYLKSKH